MEFANRLSPGPSAPPRLEDALARRRERKPRAESSVV
jgi:hypothetical protein